jgi:ribose 5-phosphate isomerase B
MSEDILISADHNGVKLKQLVKNHLRDIGHNIIDFGPYEEDGSVDYNVYASNLARAISDNTDLKGIFICGTGVGGNIVANRFKNIRSVLVHNMLTAKKSREHNDSNILCLGAWVNSDVDNIEMLDAWLNNDWGDKRHSKRVHMIDKGKTGVVLTNGVFDVVHRGHIELLKFAKVQGDKLVVALDSDRLVKINKGESRPVNTQDNRRLILESFSFVDAVIIFDSPDELSDLYLTVNPSTVVKGSEWTSAELRDRDAIPIDIDVKVYPVVEGYSSTNSINHIKSI